MNGTEWEWRRRAAPRRGCGEQCPRVTEEGDYEAKDEEEEIVCAVVVDVALEARSELALGLGRRELREELRHRAWAHVPVNLFAFLFFSFRCRRGRGRGRKNVGAARGRRKEKERKTVAQFHAMRRVTSA